MFLPQLSALQGDMVKFARAVLFGILLSVAVPATSVDAGWLSKILREAGEAGGDAARRGAGQLDEAAAVLKKLPDDVSTGAVGATVSAEGHWTFINRTGQKFTAASPDEMARLSSTLFPDGPGAAGLTVYLPRQVVFAQRSALKDLPQQARLRVVVGKKTYPLKFRTVRDVEGRSARRLYVDVRRDVLVPVTQPKVFDETIWQLGRKVNRSEVRVLSLNRNGPAALSPVGRVDAVTKRARVDRIDAKHLAEAISSLRGQTAILTGRIDQGKLFYRTPRGFDDAVDLKAVRVAAAQSDVNLVILNSPAPRQPGARNWLWQKVDVDGLSHALDQRNMADFLGTLAGGSGKVSVQVSDVGRQRATLSVVTLRQGVAAPGSETITSWIAEVASEVAGSVVTTAVEMDVTSQRRQRDLNLRIIPGIPSDYQIGYILLIVAGVMGLPVVRQWWRWLWPLEARGEYGSWFGFQAARTVRLLAFFVAFLPIFGVPAMIWNFALTVWYWITLPWRMLRWLFGGRSAQTSA